jgi:hypothetical protein
MQVEAPTIGNAAAADYFVKPTLDPTQCFQLSRKAAKKNAFTIATCGCALLVWTALFTVSRMPPEDRAPPQVLITVAAIVVLTSLSLWWVSLHLWTERWQNRLATQAFTNAGQIRSKAMDDMQQSNLVAADATALLEELTTIVENADCEFGANRFSQFWDRIEQAAVTLVKIQSAIDRLRRMQTEYENLLAGCSHNLPSLLPGCREILADTAVIDRYYAAVSLGVSKIDSELIWEHRRPLPVSTAGFATLGELVEKAGELVWESMRGLSMVENSPRQTPSSALADRAGIKGDAYIRNL